MRLLRYLFGTLTAIIIGVGIALPLATHALPLVGFEIFAVRGRSMEPTIPTGSLIVVAHRDPADLVPGDVITWEGQNGVAVTHRIVNVITGEGLRQFETQGDASQSPDGALVAENLVVGSLAFSVPVVGYALLMLTTPTGIVSWLSFGISLLLADALLTGKTQSGPPGAPRERRRERASTPVIQRAPDPDWPVHFAGVTILGDDPVLVAAMVLCSEGDHRYCRTDADPRSGVAGVRSWARAS